MLLKVVIDKIWYFNLILIVVLGSIFYLVLVRHAKVSTMQRAKDQAQLLARAEAVNISSFFDVFGQSIAILAQSPSVEAHSSNAEKVMDEFVEQWRDSGLVGGIVLTDSDGLVVYNANVSGSNNTRTSVSDRDYFVWAKNAKEGEYFVGKPVVSRLGVTIGKMIVPVSSPIYSNGQFVGILAASVEIDSLSNHYLEVMKVSNSTRSILTDENGEIIFGEPVNNSTKYIVMSQNLKLGSRSWDVNVVTPIEEIEQVLRPIYIRYFGIFVLIVLSILLYASVIDRIKRV